MVFLNEENIRNYAEDEEGIVNIFWLLSNFQRKLWALMMFWLEEVKNFSLIHPKHLQSHHLDLGKHQLRPFSVIFSIVKPK